jgi:hypothetical protein
MSLRNIKLTTFRPPDSDLISVHKIIENDITIYNCMYVVEICFIMQGRWDPITREEFNDILGFVRIL